MAGSQRSSATELGGPASCGKRGERLPGFLCLVRWPAARTFRMAHPGQFGGNCFGGEIGLKLQKHPVIGGR